MSDTKIDNRITALYCRLSLDDGNVGDSMSITSQKAILERKAKELGFCNTRFYVDDGYSGTNFERPSFKQMITDIEAGQIGVVMTKDLSRLGRNYIESGSYIEIFFPQHDVRYIAVNDGVDSINATEMDITPFKNILNEMYSRDIAKKVKSGKLIRAQQGKFMGTYAPFGLKKDPADKNHLIIDEETAPTVRFIYDLALKGYGTNRINKQLYEKKMPKPAYYKQDHFGKFIEGPDGAYDWKLDCVTRILRNPVYKGCMWVHGTSKQRFKQNGRGYIRIKDREIIDAGHEAIISPDVWDAVQDILDRHTKIKYCTSGYDNVFRGLLFCPDCGKSMLVHTDGRLPDKPLMDKTYFQCRTYRTRGKAYCSQHRINAPDLEEAVLGDIRLHAESVIKDKERFIKGILKDMGSINRDRSKSLSGRVRKLKAEVAEADERYVKLYDDLSNGIISESKFKLLSGKIEERQKVALSEIERLEEQLKTSEADAEAVELFADQLADATRIKELSSELLNRLVDKIEVSEKECADGETIQKVRIYYKFVGALI